MDISHNFSSKYQDDSDFLRCWAHQDCRVCLHEDGCSWCPFSWTCVPNNHSIPLLAPAYDENVCPHWRERWEVRTRPLGCQVSTITTLTSLVTIASTLAFVLLVFLAVRLVGALRRLHGANPGWWKAWQYKDRVRTTWVGRRLGLSKGVSGGEEDPLLGSA